MLQISGGLPRSFAYVIHAMTIYGAVSLHPAWIAVAAVAAALFYPPAGVVAGATLICFFAMPSSDDNVARRWPWKRRLGLIATTLLVCGLAVVPTFIKSSAYGERVGPHNVDKHPEMGRGGRVGGPDIPPYGGAIVSTRDALRSVFIGRGLLPARLVVLRVLAKAVIVLCGLFFLFLAMRSAAAQRLLIVALLAPLLYQVAVALAPFLYVPERYLAHLHLIEVLIVACGAAAVLTPRPFVALALTTVVMLTAGDFTNESRGLNVNASRSRPLMEFLSREERVRLVAGWPGGPVDNVPYLARKPALLTFETHHAVHGTVLLEKRRRMFAFLDAYYDGSTESMRRLRDRYGVTHLIVNASHYADQKPSYFAPFSPVLTSLQQRAVDPATMKVEGGVVFRDGALFVIDLDRLR